MGGLCSMSLSASPVPSAAVELLQYGVRCRGSFVSAETSMGWGWGSVRGPRLARLLVDEVRRQRAAIARCTRIVDVCVIPERGPKSEVGG